MKTKVALFVNGWNGENVDSFIEGFNGYFTNEEGARCPLILEGIFFML